MGGFELKGEGVVWVFVYVHECCIPDEMAPHNGLVEGCEPFYTGIICWVTSVNAQYIYALLKSSLQ